MWYSELPENGGTQGQWIIALVLGFKLIIQSTIRHHLSSQTVEVRYLPSLQNCLTAQSPKWFSASLLAALPARDTPQEAKQQELVSGMPSLSSGPTPGGGKGDKADGGLCKQAGVCDCTTVVGSSVCRCCYKIKLYMKCYIDFPEVQLLKNFERGRTTKFTKYNQNETY